MDFSVEGWWFVTVLLLTFATFLIITGAFTAYFGSGKSRKIGAGLLAGGFIVGILWILLRFVGLIGPPDSAGWLSTVIVQTLLVLVAAIVGAAAAIGLFLLAIMKS